MRLQLEMAERRADFERLFEDLIRQHANDKDGGYSQHDDIVGWLRSAAPQDQQNIRAVLLDDLRRGVPRKWGIALEVLADDAGPGVPAQLEAMARSTGERSQWRDEIIVKLASLGHRPALDLCLDGWQAGSQFQADRVILLANLIKLEPEVALNSAVNYFVEEMNSSERRRSYAANCSRLFLTVYAEVNPGYTLELVKRTMRVSPATASLLIGALLRWCGTQAVCGELKELDQQLAEGHVRRLLLSSPDPSTMPIGRPKTFTVVAEDGRGAPIPQLLIRLHVAGANSRVAENTTDSKGRAALTYTGIHLGSDQVQALAVLDGPAVVSNKVRTLWVSAVADGT
jgi:hypothetical protein